MEDPKQGPSSQKKQPWTFNYPNYTFSEGYYPVSFLSPNNEKFCPAFHLQLTGELLEAIIKNRSELKVMHKDDKVYLFQIFF